MSETLKKEDLSNVTVNSSVLQEVFGVGDRMIRYLVEQGILEKSGRGKFPLLKNIKSYITTLKVEKQGQDVPLSNISGLDWTEEKAAHENVKRQITEIKLQLIKGQVHKAEDVEAVLSDMLIKFKAKINSLPAKLAKDLENKDRIAIQKILKIELDNALEELSEYNPSDYYSEEHIDIEENVISEVIEGVIDEKC